MRKNSTKNRIVSQEVRRELSRLMLDGVKDPRVAPLTTVTDVTVAPDLKTAKVYVSVYGDAEVKKNTMDGLKNAAPYLRSMLAKNLNMRLTPQLFFVLDDSLEYAMKIEGMIASLHKEEDSGEEESSEEEEGL
ncbi:MAG: 30S ribosome-binding factor RbfA [Lachnospiraceae bacterium]|jgi:ribosome-binding factor A|nr:30S ribosome-binding factor RbfA [Lachnospiraceae bacterium]